MVTTTTWVASQKLESSTARIISRVSPPSERWWAMRRVAKPIRPAATEPMALRIENALEDQAQPDRAPADEEGGGIEIGDGRAAFEPHAGGDAVVVARKASKVR
jgi:hypothetical protein